MKFVKKKAKILSILLGIVFLEETDGSETLKSWGLTNFEVKKLGGLNNLGV